MLEGQLSRRVTPANCRVHIFDGDNFSSEPQKTTGGESSAIKEIWVFGGYVGVNFTLFPNQLPTLSRAYSQSKNVKT